MKHEFMKYTELKKKKQLCIYVAKSTEKVCGGYCSSSTDLQQLF